MTKNNPLLVFHHSQVRFVWYRCKAQQNKQKHKISFEEAATIFSDPLAVTVCDDEHSQGIQRYIIVGWSSKARTLMVVYRHMEDSINIISARQTTRRERKAYEDGCGENIILTYLGELLNHHSRGK